MFQCGAVRCGGEFLLAGVVGRALLTDGVREAGVQALPEGLDELKLALEAAGGLPRGAELPLKEDDVLVQAGSLLRVGCAGREADVRFGARRRIHPQEEVKLDPDNGDDTGVDEVQAGGHFQGATGHPPEALHSLPCGDLQLPGQERQALQREHESWKDRSQKPRRRKQQRA